MALIKCKDCGGEVSDAAKHCMKCGRPPPRALYGPPLFFFGGIGLFVAFFQLFTHLRS